MTTPDTTAKTAQVRGRFQLPDPPEDHEAKMTSFDHLTITGTAHHLAVHLGNPETTLVAGDRYMVVRPTGNLSGSRNPDLLVAFGVDPAAYKATNGYIISEQGKPPDFVLEVASRSTGRIDVTDKRRDYAALNIPEYWRFDETGEYHGARLAGDRLAEGAYVAIEIAELPDGGLQGYSAALDLHLRWEEGQLLFYDPATGRRIATFEDERARAEDERARAEDERARAEDERARAEDERARAEDERARADAEREARLAAEARVRELEELLRRQNP